MAEKKTLKERAAQLTQNFLLFAGWGALVIGGSALAHAWIGRNNAFGLALAPLFMLWSVAIHEVGHVLGAQSAGMVPALMQIGPLQFRSTSIGWRVRWTKRSPHYEGFVLAYVTPRRSLMNQQLRLIAAGPAASLLVAALLTCASKVLWPSDIAAFLLGFAAFNVAIGVANLIPRRHKYLDNDGLQIVECFRGLDESKFVLSKLNGLCATGVMAQDLPKELLDALDQTESYGRLVRSWFAIKARQNLGQWHECAAMQTEVESIVSELPPEVAAAFVDFIASLRTELACAAAIADQQYAAPLDRHLTKDLCWVAPFLESRCRALHAALDMDAQAMEDALEENERKSSRGHDRALIASEARFRAAIRTSLKTGAPTRDLVDALVAV